MSPKASPARHVATRHGLSLRLPQGQQPPFAPAIPTLLLPFLGLALPASHPPTPLPPPRTFPLTPTIKHTGHAHQHRDWVQACRKQASPSAAAELLQGCGWWAPHEQLGLIKAGRAELFPAPVQVCVCFPTSPPLSASCIKPSQCQDCWQAFTLSAQQSVSLAGLHATYCAAAKCCNRGCMIGKNLVAACSKPWWGLFSDSWH